METVIGVIMETGIEVVVVADLEEVEGAGGVEVVVEEVVEDLEVIEEEEEVV